jgi:hypothetical protein
MSSVSTHETTIEAPAELPTITIVREFDAPVEKLFRAWTEPELVVQWIGPRSIQTRIDHWDVRTGGSWRYVGLRDGEEIARFFGSFHEIRPNQRLVQTFTYEGFPTGQPGHVDARGAGQRAIPSHHRVCGGFAGRPGCHPGQRHGRRRTRRLRELDDLLATI